MDGKVVGIYICPIAGGPMKQVEKVEAIVSQGLKGDRYSKGEGSFNKGKQGSRQVSFINGIFFPGTEFEYADSRRNIVTVGVELLWLTIDNKEFSLDEVVFRALRYLDPCERPTKLSGKKQSFKEAFFDRGSIIAEVVKGGIIRVGSPVVHQPKGY